jgi:16S rRNA processing protein RimM
MENRLIEAGRVVNTHGIRGELKIEPWCDDPGLFLNIKKINIGNNEHRIKSARIHKNSVLVMIDGISSIDEAGPLIRETVYIERAEIKLDKSQYFIKDLIGLDVVNHEDSEPLGKLADVLKLPANDVYVVRGDKEYMVPAVKEFIREIDMESRVMRVFLIPGMCVAENSDKGD